MQALAGVLRFARVEPQPERLQSSAIAGATRAAERARGQRLLQIVAIKGLCRVAGAAVRACCGSGVGRTPQSPQCHLRLPAAPKARQRIYNAVMAELPAKRRLEDPAKKSVAQISKTRQLEKMKDLESRVASLSRARDVLLVKNRMTKQLLAVKARTLQQGNQVTAYLRLENAKLATALEDLKKLEGPPDAAELYRATSLLGPSFAVHDHLADVNALFADASDRFHGDRCEDI